MYKSLAAPYQTKTGQRTAKKITQMLSSTVGSAGVEIKTVDINLAQAAFSPIIATYNTNGSALLLNPTQEGSGDYQRTGKRINMKSLRVRGNLCMISTGPGSVAGEIGNAVTRIVIVYFREFHNVIPDWNAVFQGITQDGVKTSTLNSNLGPAAMGSVAVLSDKTYHNLPVTQGYYASTKYVANVPFDEYIDLGGIAATYYGTANPITMANFASGAIVMYARAQEDGTAPGTSQSSIYRDSYSRLRFTDV